MKQPQMTEKVTAAAKDSLEKEEAKKMPRRYEASAEEALQSNFLLSAKPATAEERKEKVAEAFEKELKVEETMLLSQLKKALAAGGKILLSQPEKE